MLIREACLVGEVVDGVDPHLAPTTVGMRDGHWEADTAIHEPAGAALVQALIPGSVQLAWSGQAGVEFLTVLHSLLVREAVIVCGEEDLTWKMDEAI